MTNGKFRFRDAGLGLLAALAVAGPVPGSAQETGSGRSIVEEALKDAEQDQARDAERVRRMVDEAVKGTEHAPSGKEAVNPSAPDVLRPITGDAPGTLPAGVQPEDLLDQPIRDGTGERIGTVRGLVRDESSGLARVMVEFVPLFGRPAKTSAMELEALVPAEASGDGYTVELTQVAYEAMPAYAWDKEAWRRQGA
jgi:hypothetical protein